MLLFYLKEFDKCQNSKICIITIGARTEESEETAADINTSIFRDCIPVLAKLCPETIFLIVSHPGKLKNILCCPISYLNGYFTQ